MIALEKGWHPISVFFQQGTGGSELKVWCLKNNQKIDLVGNIIAF